MSSNASEVLNAALQLTTEERAEVATALIHSLDDTVDPDAEEAWAAEIQRRVREIENGSAKMIGWETVRDEVRARLKR